MSEQKYNASGAQAGEGQVSDPCICAVPMADGNPKIFTIGYGDEVMRAADVLPLLASLRVEIERLTEQGRYEKIARKNIEDAIDAAVKAEREACAKVAYDQKDFELVGSDVAARDIAHRIRARGDSHE